MTDDDISVILEMKDFNQLHLNVSPQDKRSLKYPALVRSVIALVKNAFAAFCPGVVGKEFIELKSNSASTLVEMSSLKKALGASQQYVMDSSNRRVLLSNWKSSEPLIVQFISEHQ